MLQNGGYIKNEQFYFDLITNSCIVICFDFSYYNI